MCNDVWQHYFLVMEKSTQETTEIPLQIIEMHFLALVIPGLQSPLGAYGSQSSFCFDRFTNS